MHWRSAPLLPYSTWGYRVAPIPHTRLKQMSHCVQVWGDVCSSDQPVTAQGLLQSTCVRVGNLIKQLFGHAGRVGKAIGYLTVVGRSFARRNLANNSVSAIDLVGIAVVEDVGYLATLSLNFSVGRASINRQSLGRLTRFQIRKQRPERILSWGKNPTGIMVAGKRDSKLPQIVRAISGVQSCEGIARPPEQVTSER